MTSAYAYLSALLMALSAHPAIAAACPDITGHYAVQSGHDASSDGVRALGSQAGGMGSEVRVQGPLDGLLLVWSKTGPTSAMSSSPTRLQEGVDFDCQPHAIVLRRALTASRQDTDGQYQGQATVSISRTSKGGLSITSQFVGRPYSRVGLYDSAHLDIPKAGRQAQSYTIALWPDVASAAAAAPGPEVSESPGVLAVRGLFHHRLLGAVSLGWVAQVNTGVSVTFTASSEEAIEAFRHRLKEAGVVYTVKREPIWNNNAYFFKIVIPSPIEKG